MIISCNYTRDNNLYAVRIGRMEDMSISSATYYDVRHRFWGGFVCLWLPDESETFSQLMANWINPIKYCEIIESIFSSWAARRCLSIRTWITAQSEPKDEKHSPIHFALKHICVASNETKYDAEDAANKYIRADEERRRSESIRSILCWTRSEDGIF